MRDSSLAVCLVALMPALAHAGASDLPMDLKPKAKVNLGAPLLVYGGGSLADYFTTRSFQARGIPEGNGLVSKLGLANVKFATAAALATLDVLAQKYAPDLVWPLRVLATVFYAALSIHNGTAR